MFKDIDADIDGYICESVHKIQISSIVIPDINKNKVSELASLYQDPDSKIHKVDISDLKTRKVISSLSFQEAKKSAIGMAVIKNIETTNTTPELAVLIYTDAKSSLVQIKDTKNDQKIVKNINFLNSDYQPKAISVLPDVNGNKSDEIIVLGSDIFSDKFKMEMRDSKTGKLLKVIGF
jgi:hypothetical protein